MQLKSGCKLWWIVLPVWALDRLTKHAAMALRAAGRGRAAIPGVLSWVYAENRGAAFSMLRGRAWLLIAVTLALIAGVLLYLLRAPRQPRLERVGLWMIVGGGLGNLFDRIAFGYVVDFIRLDFVRFAIFNVADIFVCVGAALVLLASLLGGHRRKAHG